MRLKSIEDKYIRYLRRSIFVNKLNILVDFIEVPFTILLNSRYISCRTNDGLCAFKDECNRNKYYLFGPLPCKLECFEELGYFSFTEKELTNLYNDRHYQNLLIFVKSDMSLFKSAYLLSKYEDIRI